MTTEPLGPCSGATGSGGEPTEVSKADYVALASFRRALRGFMSFSETAARAAGITPQQHQALLAIKGAPDRVSLSVGEVAAHLLIRPHSAVELLDRLTQLGLVTRDSDPADHRRVLIALTPRAETILRALSSVHLRELTAIRPGLRDFLDRFEAPS